MSSNDQLFLGIKKGNLEAFSKFYDLYSQKLLNFSLLYVRSRVEAEEIVQDVFLSVWTNRDKLNLELSVEGYVFRIAKNALLNKLKKKVLQTETISSATQGLVFSHQTEDQIFLNEMKELLSEAIADLPEKRQEIFKLSREKGYSNKEIAKELNISIHTVESQIKKSIKHLRTFIEYVPLLFIWLH
ncbi:MAG: RNA polymerase sigma-70 factor [Reichenbachiella sp.]|uniref:RNA polymerase sigma-70 factor n=1 Tax=Reichenbachiella sp. TaxID=2184521 RepID=UPI00326510D6